MKLTWTYSLILIVALTAVPFAQTPKYETLAAYSYDRPGNSGLHGWNFAINKNVNNWLGFTGDISGHYVSGEYDIAEIHLTQGSARMHSFRVGPQFSSRPNGSRTMAFGHILAGATRFSFSGRPLGGRGSPGYGSETGLSVAVGGGVDMKMSSSLAIRIFQAEYHAFRRPGHDFDDGARLSFGVVFRSK